DNDGEVVMVLMVVAAVAAGGGNWRVEESGCGDRIDPVVRSVFGVGRRSPPEKFSGGGVWWPATAGVRRRRMCLEPAEKEDEVVNFLMVNFFEKVLSRSMNKEEPPMYSNGLKGSILRTP
ncbi:hypothetical protein Tco_0272488, partial [Tanacetum coccineum]